MATKGKINVDYSLRYSEAVGNTRYIANAQRYSTISYRDVLQYASKAAHVPESSLDIAMDALYDALAYFVLNGHNIKIDGIGTFYIGVNAYAMESEDDAGADAVHRLRVGFLPEVSLRQALNNVAITVSYSNPNSLSEDTSVPARLYGTFYGYSANKLNSRLRFGGTASFNNKEIYVELEGERMARELTIAGGIIVKTASGYSYVALSDSTVNVQIVKKNAEVTVYKIAANSANYLGVYLQSLVVTDTATSTVLLDDYYSYPTPYALSPEKTSIYMVNIGQTIGQSKVLKSGQSVAIPSTDYINLRIFGANLDKLVITITGATAALVKSAMNDYRYTLSNIGSTVTITATTEKEGALVFTAVYPSNGGGGSSESSPVVTSLSANGVSINNGGSSTITAGSSYNFTLAGANLSGLTAANISVPAGSTISNFAATANQVTFTLGNAAAGTIAVSYGGSTLFSVTVTEYNGGGEGEATVTSIAGIANNGSYSVEGMNCNADHTFEIVGTGLNNLAASDFKHMRGSSQISDSTFSLNEGSATARTLTWHAGFQNNDKLLVQKDGTTLFTLNMTGAMIAEY